MSYMKVQTIKSYFLPYFTLSHIWDSTRLINPSIISQTEFDDEYFRPHKIVVILRDREYRSLLTLHARKEINGFFWSRSVETVLN